MPRRLEQVPAHTAAGTLPRATEVKAIEDWIVDGNRHRNRTPVARRAPTSPLSTGDRASPSTGNNTKVLVAMAVCRRQWRSPASVS